MLKRIIPIVLIKNNRTVISRNFTIFQDIGDPIETVNRYKTWNVDEIIFLNIDRPNVGASIQSSRRHFTSLVHEVSNNCFVPLCVGGNVTSLDQAKELIESGAMDSYR